jgi:V8-like Glu-specific endopeptidase
MLKTINYGKILILQNKPIGNKKITLIGYNGKLKSKQEKLTMYKNKNEINNINKKIKKDKNNKICKNISDKFNSVII